MKSALLTSVILGVMTIASPSYAQFSSFPVSSDACSTLCLKIDLGSTNNDSYGGFNNSFNSGFNTGFNNNSSSGSSGIRWQVGVTWRLTAPDVSLAETERVKRQLEDNRSLMLALAEAITQNKNELANGLAILLAPRLGYGDSRKLLADLKTGSMNIGSAKIQLQPVTTPTAIAPPIQILPGTTPAIAPPIQLPPGTTNAAPTPIEPPATIIELR